MVALTNTVGTRYFEHRLFRTIRYFEQNCRSLESRLRNSYLVVPISNLAISNYSLFRTEFSKILKIEYRQNIASTKIYHEYQQG